MADPVPGGGDDRAGTPATPGSGEAGATGSSVPADPAAGGTGTTGTGTTGTGTTGTGSGPGELRQRLLAAAAAVFAREGYAGTRILDIVREAGVSTGAVYGRFDSKNDLLREAVVERSARSGVLISGAHDLGELVRHTARLADQPLRSTEAMRLEAYVTARREPEVAGALSDAHDRWREGVEPLVAAAEADGTLADDLDPEAVLFLVRTLYLGLLLHRGSGMAGPDPEAWAELVERLVAGLGHPAPDDTRAGGQAGEEVPDDGR